MVQMPGRLTRPTMWRTSGAFAERCEDDRHHFRFIISPEDGAALGDLKTFTRELMRNVEKDNAN